MKAIKRINNNVALCISKSGKEFMARGKGIGFHDFPYELDIKDVERTYYDVDPMYYSMINDIPEEVLDIATKIVDKASLVIENPFGSNIIFTLADHINFSIERNKKNMDIKLPFVYDIEHLFEKEYDMGLYGLKLIRQEMNVYLPQEEAAYIALHLINAEEQNKQIENLDDKAIEDITKIIEDEYSMQIDKKNFNYSRFVSHLHYLLKRGRSKHLVQSDNSDIFNATKDAYPKTYICSNKICEYLKDKLNLKMSEEEQLYLMLHVNRLCTREECYQ